MLSTSIEILLEFIDGTTRSPSSAYLLNLFSGSTGFWSFEFNFIYLFIYLFFVSGIKAHSQTTYNNILHSQDEKIRKLL